MANGIERSDDLVTPSGSTSIPRASQHASPESAGKDQDAHLATGAIIPGEGQRFDGQGESMARRRYQKGRVILRGKAHPVWVGRWREDVIEADGTIKRVERSEILGTKRELPTKCLATRRLELELARINSPTYRARRTATLAEFSEKWERLVLTQHKPSTVRAAQSHLRSHVLPQLGRLRLDQIGREQQQIFVSKLSETASRKTVLNVLGTLSTMLQTAKKWGYISELVHAGELALPDQGPQAEARFFTPDQVRQIIDLAEEPFRTMFAVLAMTAMRAGELSALTLDDLDFDRRIIQVRRSVWRGRVQSLKSKASQKPLPMPGVLVEILREYLKSWRETPERWLFSNSRGRPYSTNNVVQRTLWPILDALRIPRCGLHAFRHYLSFLTMSSGSGHRLVQVGIFRPRREFGERLTRHSLLDATGR
jgi:integrase